jgi:NH3-dependent NAD+ synthetase
MRGLVACLSGGICSITAAVMVRDLGFKLCIGMFIYSEQSSDEEDIVVARQQAEYLHIPLKSISVTGYTNKHLTSLSIASLTLQLPVDCVLTGIVIGWSMRDLQDPLRFQELERWKSIQQRLTNACSLYVHGPYNIHTPLLEYSYAEVEQRAQELGVAHLGKARM